MILTDYLRHLNLPIGIRVLQIHLQHQLMMHQFVMLTGYPEKFKRLYDHNPSVNRIFHTHELKGLSDADIKNFYTTIFSKYDIWNKLDSFEN